MTRTQLFDAIRPFAPDKRFHPDDVKAIDDLADRFGLARLTGARDRKPSASITTFIRNMESYAKPIGDGRVTAYMPTPDDVPTIGFGTTGPDIRMGTIWTREQAESRFAADLASFANVVSTAIGSAPTTQGQFDAMVSLAYNIGKKAFADSTLLKLHIAGDHAEAQAQFARWNKQKGKILAGLTKRRAAEAQFYGGAA